MSIGIVELVLVAFVFLLVIGVPIAVILYVVGRTKKQG